MSQQVKVNRELVFSGDALQDKNVVGDLFPERIGTFDAFDQTTLDATNKYVVTVAGSSDTIALSGGGVPGVTFTTGNVDDDIAFMSTALITDITQKPSAATKIKIADVSGTIIFWGFSDATTESTPAATIDAAGGTPTAAATDAVGFVCDADYGTSGLYCMAVNAGGTVAVRDTGIDWVDNASYRLKIDLDSSGNAKFFVDGVQKAYIAAAVADVPLGIITNAGTRANDGSNSVYQRYLARWQDAP